MKEKLKALLNLIFRRAGLEVVSRYQQAQNQTYVSILQDLYANAGHRVRNDSMEFIVFSKDRPIQLHALLRSYLEFASPPVPVHILFCAPNPEQRQAYQEVESSLDQPLFRFIEEKKFRADLLTLVNTIGSEKICFLVDDLFFKDAVDLEQFARIDTRKFVASLRMAPHFSYSYTSQKELPLPALKNADIHGMHSWDWNTGVLDWNYPLSVDGHLFDTAEMRVILERIPFKAPNSLEAALQIMQPLFVLRPGLCFERSVLINNPCNKVQQENFNFHGNFSAEELLKKWQQGYRIDYSGAYGSRNSGPHQEIDLKFIPR